MRILIFSIIIFGFNGCKQMNPNTTAAVVTNKKKIDSSLILLAEKTRNAGTIA